MLTTVSESDLQKKIIKDLKNRGFYAKKIISANVSGVPDILSCVNGRFVAFEIKAPGKKATTLQQINLNNIKACGGKAYVVDSYDNYLDIINAL